MSISDVIKRIDKMKLELDELREILMNFEGEKNAKHVDRCCDVEDSYNVKMCYNCKKLHEMSCFVIVDSYSMCSKCSTNKH